jgi:5-(carboxyamino)imidazole ribonucleotide synthase
MLALAGYPLGFEFQFLDPTAGSPASQVARQHVAEYTDSDALALLAACDVVTFEFENVPDQAANELAAAMPVFPPPDALRVSQDRLVEKRCLQSLNIATPRFEPVDDEASLREAVDRLGLPSVLKTRRFGYDGKGQCVLRQTADLSSALGRVGQGPLILEEFVSFERELSLIAVRGRDGSVACYPLIENQHHAGILRRSSVPARTEGSVERDAAASVQRLLEHLNYVGVLTVEFFEVGGQLLANEFAPRVHNSGHLTIEAASTSQFENHLRAITGLPLGLTDCPGPAAMLNLIGTLPNKEAVLRIPGTHYHDYGKRVRPGRKVGHVTITAPTEAELETRVAAVSALL